MKHSEEENPALFYIGQLVHHKIFNYRGVIIDVDPIYLGSEEWYETVAKTRPPKDQPWYRVLVDKEELETYVAQRNLEADKKQEPIDHNQINDYFSEFKDCRYLPLYPDN